MKAINTSEPVRFATVSPARQRLVIAQIRRQFGRIERLRIVGSEPQWEPSPTIIQTVKLPADADIPDPTEGDFVLKKQFVDLFECFDRWQNATILRLEFRLGLPCFVEVILGEDASNAQPPDRSHP